MLCSRSMPERDDVTKMRPSKPENPLNRKSDPKFESKDEKVESGAAREREDSFKGPPSPASNNGWSLPK